MTQITVAVARVLNAWPNTDSGRTSVRPDAPPVMSTAATKHTVIAMP